MRVGLASIVALHLIILAAQIWVRNGLFFWSSMRSMLVTHAASRLFVTACLYRTQGSAASCPPGNLTPIESILVNIGLILMAAMLSPSRRQHLSTLSGAKKISLALQDLQRLDVPLGDLFHVHHHVGDHSRVHVSFIMSSKSSSASSHRSKKSYRSGARARKASRESLTSHANSEAAILLPCSNSRTSKVSHTSSTNSEVAGLLPCPDSDGPLPTPFATQSQCPVANPPAMGPLSTFQALQVNGSSPWAEHDTFGLTEIPRQRRPRRMARSPTFFRTVLPLSISGQHCDHSALPVPVLIACDTSLARTKDAEALMYPRNSSGVSPGASIFTSMIVAYGQAHKLQDAFAVFERMQQMDVTPKRHTCIALFNACMENDSPARAKHVLQMMVAYGLALPMSPGCL